MTNWWDSLDTADAPQTVDPDVAAGVFGSLLNIFGDTTSSSDPLRNPVRAEVPDVEVAPTTPATAETTTATTAGAVQPFAGDAPQTGAFGEGRDGGHVHAGIDFGVPANTSIVSMAGGTVTQVVTDGEGGGYGNFVIVDHGGGITTRYAHLNSVGVAPGTKVAAGQPLGLSGSTGQSTGPHLHFEVMQDGQAVDPTPFLAGGAHIVGHAAETGEVSAYTPEEIAAAQLSNATSILAGEQPTENTQAKKAKTSKTGATTGADDDPGALNAFLSATRQHESGGDYTVYNKSGLSNASGAYQFIGSTWGGHGGYQNAADAPPEVQDAKAREMASALFEKYGSWRLVAIAWYGGPGVADQVAAGKDPGAPDQQGSYLAYGDTIKSMMSGG